MKSVIISALILMFCSSFSMANGLDGFQFMKISAKDQKAVVKAADGSLKLVGVGDKLGDALQITDIADGRVVLVETGKDGQETIIVRLSNNKHRIERISNQIKRPTYIVPIKSSK